MMCGTHSTVLQRSGGDQCVVIVSRTPTTSLMLVTSEERSSYRTSTLIPTTGKTVTTQATFTLYSATTEVVSPTIESPLSTSTEDILPTVTTIAMSVQPSAVETLEPRISEMPKSQSRVASVVPTSIVTFSETVKETTSAVLQTGTTVTTLMHSPTPETLQPITTRDEVSQGATTTRSSVPTLAVKFSEQPRLTTTEAVSQSQIPPTSIASTVITVKESAFLVTSLIQPHLNTTIPSVLTATAASSMTIFDHTRYTIPLSPTPSQQPPTGCISVNTTDPSFPSLGEMMMAVYPS